MSDGGGSSARDARMDSSFAVDPGSVQDEAKRGETIRQPDNPTIEEETAPDSARSEQETNQASLQASFQRWQQIQQRRGVFIDRRVNNDAPHNHINLATRRTSAPRRRSSAPGLPRLSHPHDPPSPDLPTIDVLRPEPGTNDRPQFGGSPGAAILSTARIERTRGSTDSALSPTAEREARFPSLDLAQAVPLHTLNPQNIRDLTGMLRFLENTQMDFTRRQTDRGSVAGPSQAQMPSTDHTRAEFTRHPAERMALGIDAVDLESPSNESSVPASLLAEDVPSSDSSPAEIFQFDEELNPGVSNGTSSAPNDGHGTSATAANEPAQTSSGVSSSLFPPDDADLSGTTLVDTDEDEVFGDLALDAPEGAAPLVDIAPLDAEELRDATQALQVRLDTGDVDVPSQPAVRDEPQRQSLFIIGASSSDETPSDPTDSNIIDERYGDEVAAAAIREQRRRADARLLAAQHNQMELPRARAEPAPRRHDSSTLTYNRIDGEVDHGRTPIPVIVDGRTPAQRLDDPLPDLRAEEDPHARPPSFFDRLGLPGPSNRRMEEEGASSAVASSSQTTGSFILERENASPEDMPPNNPDGPPEAHRRHLHGRTRELQRFLGRLPPPLSPFASTPVVSPPLIRPPMLDPPVLSPPMDVSPEYSPPLDLSPEYSPPLLPPPALPAATVFPHVIPSVIISPPMLYPPMLPPPLVPPQSDPLVIVSPPTVFLPSGPPNTGDDIDIDDELAALDEAFSTSPNGHAVGPTSATPLHRVSRRRRASDPPNNSNHAQAGNTSRRSTFGNSQAYLARRLSPDALPLPGSSNPLPFRGRRPGRDVWLNGVRMRQMPMSSSNEEESDDAKVKKRGHGDTGDGSQ